MAELADEQSVSSLPIESYLPESRSFCEDAQDERQLSSLTAVLDQVQEQPWLLDRHLDALVQTPLAALRSRCDRREDILAAPTQRIARLVYWLTKTRGHKTVGA